MISSSFSPPFSAGPLVSTRPTMTPFETSKSKASAMVGSISPAVYIPKYPLLTEPSSMRSSIIRLANLTGMAKPIPSFPPEREAIAEFIPTKVPFKSTRAPPELPGLIAASV